MIALDHNTAVTLPPGVYQYIARVGTGGVTFEMDDGAENFANMVDGVFTTDSDGTMQVTEFSVRVQLTGTATAKLSPAVGNVFIAARS